MMPQNGKVNGLNKMTPHIIQMMNFLPETIPMKINGNLMMSTRLISFSGIWKTHCKLLMRRYLVSIKLRLVYC